MLSPQLAACAASAPCPEAATVAAAEGGDGLGLAGGPPEGSPRSRLGFARGLLASPSSRAPKTCPLPENAAKLPPLAALGPADLLAEDDDAVLASSASPPPKADETDFRIQDQPSEIFSPAALAASPIFSPAAEAASLIRSPVLASCPAASPLAVEAVLARVSVDGALVVPRRPPPQSRAGVALLLAALQSSHKSSAVDSTASHTP
mmetsp:Transcript_33099/g.77462  ORF Transcript_33099/g.77462 Transcript_33099/m.77462 type:complete len:206 (+) Transcript_33099:155-772(+)